MQLTVTLYGYTERPYLFLSSEQMRKLADMGADLGIDIYDLTSTEE